MTMAGEDGTQVGGQVLEREIGTLDREKLKNVFGDEQLEEKGEIYETWLLDPAQARAKLAERMIEQQEVKELLVTYVQDTESFWKSVTDPELSWKERFGMLGDGLKRQYRTRKYNEASVSSLLNTMVTQMGSNHQKFGKMLGVNKQEREELEVVVKDLLTTCKTLAPEVEALEAESATAKAGYEEMLKQHDDGQLTLADLDAMEQLNDAEGKLIDIEAKYIEKVTDLSLSWNLATLMREWLGVVRKNYINAKRQYHQFDAYLQKTELLVSQIGQGMDIMEVQLLLEQDAETFNKLVNPSMTNAADIAILVPLVSTDSYMKIGYQETIDHLRGAADKMDDVQEITLDMVRDQSRTLLEEMGYKVTPPEAGEAPASE